MSRKINWTPFKKSSIEHPLKIRRAGVVGYNDSGQIFLDVAQKPSDELELAFYAEFNINGGYSSPGNAFRNWSLIFKEDGYCPVWSKCRHSEPLQSARYNQISSEPWRPLPIRASSLKQHRKYFSHKTWLTVKDRDLLFSIASGGMYDEEE